MKHANLRTVLCIIICVLASLMISGCAIIPADITQLESPPKLTSEQQAIENALEAKVTSKIDLSYPLEGDYRSAFVLKDIDNDGSPEAFACYSTANGPHIAFLDEVKGKWKDIGDIGSSGNEIDCIAFGDFEGDGVDDIAVGWSSFTSTDLTLMVYHKKGNSFVKSNLGSFTEMKTLDLDGDGKPDILTIKLNGDEKIAVASMISYRSGKLGVVAQAPLDSTVTSYAGIYEYDTSDNPSIRGVLIDGYKSAHNMVTELVYYKSGKLISPFYNKSTHTTLLTMRPVTYQCLDIDQDGIVEIPTPTPLPYLPDKANDNKNWLVKWSNFDGKKGLIPKLSCIMNYAENYYFIYPVKWGSSVTVNSSSNGTEWDFCKWEGATKGYGPILFSIFVYSESSWNNITNKSLLYRLAEKNGVIYAALIPTQLKVNSLSLTLAEITKDFNLLNQ